VSFSYDAMRRQLSETSGGVTHNYKYDLAGNRIKVTFGGPGLVIDSDYDEQNRLETLTQGTSVTTYTYDADGNNGV